MQVYEAVEQAWSISRHLDQALVLLDSVLYRVSKK